MTNEVPACVWIDHFARYKLHTSSWYDDHHNSFVYGYKSKLEVSAALSGFHFLSSSLYVAWTFSSFILLIFHSRKEVGALSIVARPVHFHPDSYPTFSHRHGLTVIVQYNHLKQNAHYQQQTMLHSQVSIFASTKHYVGGLAERCEFTFVTSGSLPTSFSAAAWHFNVCRFDLLSRIEITLYENC